MYTVHVRDIATIDLPFNPLFLTSHAVVYRKHESHENQNNYILMYTETIDALSRCTCMFV